MIVAVFLLGLALGQNAYTGDIWPLPQMVNKGEKIFQINADQFTFTAGMGSFTCEVVKKAVHRYEKYLKDLSDRKYEMNLHPLDRSVRGLSQIVSDPALLTNIYYILGEECEEWPSPEMHERYDLHIGAAGAYLYSDSVWGILRGLESFYQSIYAEMDDFGNPMLKIQEADVNDFPRFKHRGILVDTARHFLPMTSIMEVLDGMTMNKFNVMHWHIVDDQSFPYGSKVLPDLPKHGAYYGPKKTHVYSIEQIKEIMEYARLRGIRVVPEFDTPGHVGGAGKGQPGLQTQCCGPDGKFNGNYGPADPTNEANYKFMDTLIKELRSVFKDQYLHLGGDEVGFGCWKSNPNITAWMKKENLTDYAKLEEIWIQRVLNITENNKFDYIVWEEVFNNGININKNTVVEVWLPYTPKKETFKVTAAGYRALISAPWYLDLISYGTDWHSYYSYEPLDFNGTAAQEALVMGGEACLWAEFVDASNYVSRLFPRASAVAERLWSAREVNDVNAAKPRILQQRCKMVARKVHAEPANGPSACPLEFDAQYSPV